MSEAPLRLLTWLISSPENRGAAPARPSTPAGWAEFLRLATSRHRVAPAVRHELLRCGIEVPEEVRSALDSAYRDAATAALAQKGETLRIAAIFERERIPFAVLKGWPLAESCMGSAALRQAKDLDLLVAPDDAERGMEALTRAGYLRVIGADAETAKDAMLFRPETGVELELHWRALAQLDMPGLLPREAAPAGCAPVPGMAAHLAYLAAHGTVHAWDRLKWLLDIRAIVARRSEAELSGDLDHATACGAGRALRIAFHLAARYLDEPIPPHLRQLGAFERLLAGLAARTMLAGENSAARIWTRLLRLLFMIGATEGWAGRRALLRQVFSPRDDAGGMRWRTALRTAILGGFPWTGTASPAMRPIRRAALRLRLRAVPWLLRPLAAAAMLVATPAVVLAGAIRASRDLRGGGPGLVLRMSGFALWHNCSINDYLRTGLHDPGIRAVHPVGDWFLLNDQRALRRFFFPPRIAVFLGDEAASKQRHGQVGQASLDGSGRAVEDGIRQHDAGQGGITSQDALEPPEGYPGVPVLRVLTGRGARSRAEALMAFARFPSGAATTSQGLTLHPVDLRTGEVRSLPEHAPVWRNAPEPREGYAAREVPSLPSALDLAMGSHDLLLVPAPFVAWDIVISARGPVLLKGNADWDVDIWQEMLRQPVATGRFRDLILEHLPC